MKKFNSLKSIPAYLPIVNIDTDMIIPKQFLKTIKRTGLGKNLFFEIRYDNDGKEIKDFVLNQEPYNEYQVQLFVFFWFFFVSIFVWARYRPSIKNNFF